MTRPRSSLISLSDTPWYHVVSRCVPRAFLCGDDSHSGQNYDHRREWIVAWIMRLAAVFSLDIAAYAVMSNHYHIVLRVDVERAKSWSMEEVLQRWTQLFIGPVLVQRYLSADRERMKPSEIARVEQFAEEYRRRFTNISWFMRVLNQNIARQANSKDQVKGPFWEGRFKSQALLDETALLAAMAYVDLNPIRAGVARTPGESDFEGERRSPPEGAG
jgi:REP element-mobilizing transposase RayT